MMTEVELSTKLGIVFEPEKNRVTDEPAALLTEMLHLQAVFAIATEQRESIGVANKELWLEFLPWYSLN